MSKLPSFQFYVGDWMKNAELRRCSPTARGAWMDILCLMFESETRGVLRSNGSPWTIDEIARATGVPEQYIQELVDKGVMKRSARTNTFWSPRQVRDELKRRRLARNGQIGGRVSRPKAEFKQPEKQTGSKSKATGEAKTGSSYSSSYSSSDRNTTGTPVQQADDTEVDIPQSLLRDERFLTVWRDWIAFRRKRRYSVLPDTLRRQLKFLTEQPDPVAVIETGLRNGWQGLFPLTEKDARRNHGKKRIPANVVTVLGCIDDVELRRERAVQLLGELGEYDTGGIGL